MDSKAEVGKRLRNHLSPVQYEAFGLFARKLVEGRRRASLTSLKDRDAIERRHFLESIALVKALEEAGALESPVIDIGTGAGIPGLPLKILRPDVKLTLVEATRKKVRFLEGLVEELSLDGVQIVNERAEVAARDPAHREVYALGVARAVAPLRILTELALPFVRLGGHLAAIKGSGAAREINDAEHALVECGGTIDRQVVLDVQGPGPAPILVFIRKVAATPERYPRRTGVPKKRPL